VGWQAKRALLGLPNSLGWRFHFGIRAPEGQKATLDLAAACVKDLAQRKLVDVEAAERVQEVGLMLFTFVTDPRAQHAPMRVRVFQTRSSSAASSAQDLGTLSATAGWYPFDEVLWLPPENMNATCRGMQVKRVTPVRQTWDRAAMPLEIGSLTPPRRKRERKREGVRGNSLKERSS
jgi:hypothetical protein